MKTAAQKLFLILGVILLSLPSCSLKSKHDECEKHRADPSGCTKLKQCSWITTHICAPQPQSPDQECLESCKYKGEFQGQKICHLPLPLCSPKRISPTQIECVSQDHQAERCVLNTDRYGSQTCNYAPGKDPCRGCLTQDSGYCAYHDTQCYGVFCW